jgi:spore coat protein JA
MENQIKAYYPYISPFDPCQPQRIKAYDTSPQLYIAFQPSGLPQYSPYEALKRGTLWPVLYSPYESQMLERRYANEQ